MDGADHIVKNWVQRFNALLDGQEGVSVEDIFTEECYWRDLVAFTWNIVTMERQGAIAALLSRSNCGKFVFYEIAQPEDGFTTAWLTFETPTGRGKAHVRLKEGKAFTLLTSLEELKGFEERRGLTRETGIGHGARKAEPNWLEKRSARVAALGYSEQPYCVIIGGGQGGLALGACLNQLGVSNMIIEKNAKAGDSWRKRYRSLVLHDPVWYDHLPYIPFPAHWPVFTPKDKMGDWLEMYARVMELNFWGSTECKKAAFDPDTKTWTVKVNRDGQPLTLRPKQLVFATGSYGPPRMISVPGTEEFGGETLHSCAYQSGEKFRGKRCVVIGANSSGHDIAADLWAHDADVTMVQRSPTTVVRSETLMETAFKPLYSEEAVARGVDVDTADLIFASTPFRLWADKQKPLAAAMATRDAELLSRLHAAGFQTDLGEDGSGQMMKAFRTGSGFYLDVGCSELIASGEIRIRSGVEPRALKPRSLVLSDGSEIAADVIIFATGYLPMNEWVAQIISRKVADLIGPNWGYGSGVKGDPGPWQGELRNMWKPLAQDALWFHGGNLHLSRHYSKYLALQLKARMEGLDVQVYQTGLKPR